MGNSFAMPQGLLPPVPNHDVIRECAVEIVEVGNKVEPLLPYCPEWLELGARPLEPNPFYEAPLLLPALQHLRHGPIRIVLVWHRPSGASAEEGGHGRLIGLFPLQKKRFFGLPYYVLWKHSQCYLTTPLLDLNHATEALAVFLAWLDRQGIYLKLPIIVQHGMFARALAYLIERQGRVRHTIHGHQRPLLTPLGDPPPTTALSNKRRREYERQRRRLAEQGRVELSKLQDEKDLAGWTEAFLSLESRSWKGASGTALACDSEERRYFQSIVKGSFQHQRLEMLMFSIDQRPIAMQCNFLSGSGAFGYKMAYDPDYAKYSPGILLELERMRRFSEITPAHWVDSCTHDPGSPLYTLWPSRRSIANWRVSARSPLARAILRAYTGARQLARYWPQSPATRLPDTAQDR